MLTSPENAPKPETTAKPARRWLPSAIVGSVVSIYILLLCCYGVSRGSEVAGAVLNAGSWPVLSVGKALGIHSEAGPARRPVIIAGTFVWWAFLGFFAGAVFSVLLSKWQQKRQRAAASSSSQ